MNSILEPIANHPWVAIGLGAWMYGFVAIIGDVAKECVASIATRTRAPKPDPVREYAVLKHMDGEEMRRVLDRDDTPRL